MRILFVLQDWPLPPRDGITHLNYNLLKYMSGSHECDVVCFHDHSKRQPQSFSPNITLLEHIAKPSGIDYMLSRTRRFLSAQPISLAHYDSKSMASLLQRSLRGNRYSLVHFDVLNMAQYLPFAPGVATVLSAVDAYSHSYRRVAKWGSRLSTRFAGMYGAWAVDRYERNVFSRFTKVSVVARVHADYLRARNPAIDVEATGSVVGDEFLDFPVKACRAEARTLLFFGLLSTEGVVSGLDLFLRNVYPKVLSKFPDTQLIVMGRGTPPRLRDRLDKTSNLRFIGDAPDPMTQMEKASVVIFPLLRERGVKTKVLQAMAMQRPVVGSSVAFDEISVTDGVEAFVRDDPEMSCEAILRLLADPELAVPMAVRARDFVRLNYSSAVFGAKMQALYQRAIDKFSRESSSPSQKAFGTPAGVSSGTRAGH